MNTEILSGIHSVLEAIKAKRRTVFEIYVTKDYVSNRIDNILALAKNLHIPVKKISLGELEGLAKTSQHQNIAAKVSQYLMVEIFDILEISKDKKQFLLILDSIVDPHNLGALIRTGLCAGVCGFVIPKDRSAQPSPTVSRTSAGALEHILLAQVTNLSNTIKMLKEEGIWIIGLDHNAQKTVFETDLSVSLGIVIGGEEKGVRHLVKKQCDDLISIPQTGLIDSLNASVAGSIVMYETYRQRIFLK